MLLDSTGIQLYQAIMGSLMLFLSQCTRYDITYAANQLARAMKKPSELHMSATKAPSPLPKGIYGPGNHVQDRVFRNDGVLRRELGKQP